MNRSYRIQVTKSQTVSLIVMAPNEEAAKSRAIDTTNGSGFASTKFDARVEASWDGLPRDEQTDPYEVGDFEVRRGWFWTGYITRRVGDRYFSPTKTYGVALTDNEMFLDRLDLTAQDVNGMTAVLSAMLGERLDSSVYRSYGYAARVKGSKFWGQVSPRETGALGNYRSIRALLVKEKREQAVFAEIEAKNAERTKRFTIAVKAAFESKNHLTRCKGGGWTTQKLLGDNIPWETTPDAPLLTSAEVDWLIQKGYLTVFSKFARSGQPNQVVLTSKAMEAVIRGEPITGSI